MTRQHKRARRRDYSDGHGWGKLDNTAARGLADIIDTFGDSRTRHDYTALLLCLYASLGQDGVAVVGRDTLAKRAKVSTGKARRFLELGEAAGWLVRAGERRTTTGTYTVRRFDFDWRRESVSPSALAPADWGTAR